MRYLFVLALFVLGIVMLGGQHTHNSWEVYGVAEESHRHRVSEVTGAAKCGRYDSNEITCSRYGSGHTH